MRRWRRETSRKRRPPWRTINSRWWCLSGCPFCCVAVDGRILIERLVSFRTCRVSFVILFRVANLVLVLMFLFLMKRCCLMLLNSLLFVDHTSTYIYDVQIKYVHDKLCTILYNTFSPKRFSPNKLSPNRLSPNRLSPDLFSVYWIRLFDFRPTSCVKSNFDIKFFLFNLSLLKKLGLPMVSKKPCLIIDV